MYKQQALAILARSGTDLSELIDQMSVQDGTVFGALTRRQDVSEAEYSAVDEARQAVVRAEQALRAVVA